MSKFENWQLIDKTVEITVAKMSSSTIAISGASGKSIGDFMQAIYDKHH